MSIASMASSAERPFGSLRGIGPTRAAALRAAGYACAQDILMHAPRVLGPPPPWCDDGPLPRSALVRVRGRVLKARPGFIPGRGRLLVVACARADGHPFSARFFRAGFLQRRFIVGEWFDFLGRTDARQGDLLNHPAFTHLRGGAGEARPVDAALRLAWSAPDGFGDAVWRDLIDACLEDPGLADPLGELAPEAWRAVLRTLHRPADPVAWELARRAVAWREAVALARGLAAQRGAHAPGTAWRWDDAIHARALARLPFTLTDGQLAALAEIRSDLHKPRPMARLLGGDVGSGKTALALVAALAVIADGGQVAILAPTAVLAAQHHRFASTCLAGSRVKLGLLTGASEGRGELLAGLANGGVHLVVGTHALLEDGVRFARLALVVIDEQHRFGVAQRATLVAKSPPATQADLLLTTATPIPQSLALTAYGDLAITRIAGLPPGRTPATTTISPFPGWSELGALLAAEPGRSFVVCPRISADDEDAPLSVAEAATAARSALGADAVSVLTGAQSETAKLAALADFAAGRTRCLVATTVVEVGVDVPEATLAVVLDAQRFGLATLHQLRGRVGRGTLPGRCVLLTRGDGEAATRRLAILAASHDGLAIAEADLAERGPGELLGERQHGLCALRCLDLARDLDLLQRAHARITTDPAPPLTA